MSEERKLVSILFADIVGSTAFGAGHDAELVRGVMRRYFARMHEIATAHGGTVEKYIGDAVMVVFGVPRLHEDDAERAVRSALAMRDAVDDLNRSLAVELALRIGVNSGEVVSGVGEEHQFLITGDPVNVAARLQQGADPGEVVVGSLTERLTRDAIDYQPRDAVVAKGKVEPVTAFRAVRAKLALPGQLRPSPGLVGREREVRRLQEIFASVVEDRRAAVVTVLGPAGVGKSRLVAEVLSRIAEHGDVRILRGRCLPYGAGITYWALMDVIRQDAGIAPSDDRLTALARIDTRLAELVPGDIAIAIGARIATLMGLESASVALPGIPAERMDVELTWGVRRYLEAIAALGPLIVAIDDLQWAESPALELLAQLADGSVEGGFLLLCVARPELLERYPAWSAGRLNASLIGLEPLDATETQTLIARILGTEGPSPLLDPRIAERAAGNPLYCEELVLLLIEAGRLEVSGGGWRSTPGDTVLPLPESIQAIVAARIDGLPSAEKVALQRASVVGERFTLEQLLALDDDLGTAPEALLQKGLFERDREDPSGRALRFKHLLIRDVAYGSLAKADRALLHDAAGTWLETTMPDRTAEVCELLAYHAVCSAELSRELAETGPVVDGRAARALLWSCEAGDRALALYAIDQASVHFERAIEVGRHEPAPSALLIHAYVANGRALELRGSFDAALATYESLEQLAEGRRDDRLRADALARQATIYRTATSRFDPARAAGLLDDAHAIAQALDDQTLIAQLQRDRIHIQLFRGQVDEAIAAGEASLAAADACGSAEQRMYTANDIVCAYREAGDFARARAAGELATTIAEELGDQPIGANSRATRAGVEFLAGDYDTALRLWLEGHAIAERIGNDWGRSTTAGGLAWVWSELGDLGRAIEAGELSLRLAAGVNFLMSSAMYEADLAGWYRSAGEDEAARRHLDTAETLVDARFPFLSAWTLGHRSRAATARGELDLAAECLERGREHLRARSEWFVFQHAQVRLADVELLLAQRRYREAANAARSAAAAQAALARPYVADLELLEGIGLWLDGDFEAAAAALARAEATASALRSGQSLWRIHAASARVERARGRSTAATEHRAAAEAIAADIETSLGPLGLGDRFREGVAAPLLDPMTRSAAGEGAVIG